MHGTLRNILFFFGREPRRLTRFLAASFLPIALSLSSYACGAENQAPTWGAEGPRIFPADPGREVALQVNTGGLFDPDGDTLTIFVDWWVNDLHVGQSSALDPDSFSRGDAIYVRVRASDGSASSDTRDSAEVIVRNTPPQIRSASIENASVIHGFSEVRAVADVWDADNDPVSIEWTWFLNGAPLPQTGDRIALQGVPAGSELSARGNPYDGSAHGGVLHTSEVQVGALPTEAVSVRIVPEQPTHRDDLHCILESPSLELPTVSSIAWGVEASVRGVAQAVEVPGTSGEELSFKFTTAGDSWTCTVLWPGGLSLERSVSVVQKPSGGNILLVLLDDVGVDNVGVYAEQKKPPPTPTLDTLAASGVLFRNAHTYPVCSPSRAALVTGRYGRRTGIGSLVKFNKPFQLATEEIGIAEILQSSTRHQYATSLVGKWHLANPRSPDWLMHPAAFGFDWFAVSMLNLTPFNSSKRPYFEWPKNTNGVSETSHTYATTDQVNDAIARIDAMPEPWFLFLSFSAPHVPAHIPPAKLHSYKRIGEREAIMYDAMVEALDTELGRLIKSIPPEVFADTTIIVMGDNGTPKYAATHPFKAQEAKGELHDGGTRVPLIISGPLVQEPGSEVAALVHIVDILPTVAEMGGVEIEGLYASEDGPGSLVDWPLDGESLVPFLSEPSLAGREVIYTEKFGPNGTGVSRLYNRQSVRDKRWRLIRRDKETQLFYDLTTKYPNSGRNLLDRELTEEASLALERLSLALDEISAEIAE